jgi:LysM repeat protein
MALNGIADPHKIRVGQKLRVKGSAKAAPTVDKTKPAEDKPVDVKPVDETVAPVEPVDNGTAPTSIESLLKDVGASTSVPKTPAVATPAVATPAVATPTVAGAREHVVREGEDIYAIALHYKVRPVDIRSLNNLTSNVLTAGMVIKIPPAAQ